MKENKVLGEMEKELVIGEIIELIDENKCTINNCKEIFDYIISFLEDNATL